MYIEENLDELLSVYDRLQDTLSDYDKKLQDVLQKHEMDFLQAYKQHMDKVIKELSYLKSKANEQEVRLAEDERILAMKG